MDIVINDALSEFLYPFRKYWNPSYCVIKRIPAGVGFWNRDCVFYDEYDNMLMIPGSDEINSIVKLWDEDCLLDLILDRFIEHIVQNMYQFGVSELKVKL